MRWSWVALAAALGGCGGGDAPLAPVALPALSDALVDAQCAWATRCVHVPDDATCRRLLDPKQFDTRRAQDAVAAGRLDYDADAAALCADATARAGCLTQPFSHPSCDAMFVGLVTEGDACTSAFECAGGADCGQAACDDQCCRGICGAPVPEPPPLPARTDIGGACASHPDCVPDAYCETDGVCTALPDEPGQRCLFGCARGDLFCDLDTLECAAFAGRGEACDPTGASAPACDPAWSYCDGTCRDRPGADESCDSDARRCIATTYCDGDPGICRARGDEDTPCTSSGECEIACGSGNGRCQAYRTCTL